MIKKLTSMGGKELERFIKFAVVGTIGFALDFGIGFTLIEGFSWDIIPGNTIGFVAAVISNFILNRYWTYPDSREKSILAQLGQFAVVSIVGLFINNGVVFGLEPVFAGPMGFVNDLTGMALSGFVPAKLVATMVVLFWNFFVNRYWTYNDVD